MTDTVGFVRKLPHQLVEAFKSTLEVAGEADLLVHIVDSSAAEPEMQIDAVHAVLQEIGGNDVPELLAFNKSDIAPDNAARLAARYPGSVAISANQGDGVDELAAQCGRSVAGSHCDRRAGGALRARRRARCGAPRRRGARRDRRRRSDAAPGSVRRGGPCPLPGVRGSRDRVRAAAVSVRSARRACRHRRRSCPAGASISRSARRATLRLARWSPRWRRATPSAATPRRSAHAAFREAAAGWLDRRFGVAVDPPRKWRRASARRSSSPASRNGCGCARLSATRSCIPRSATPPMRWERRSRAAEPVAYESLDEISDDDAERALCLWVNTPANPSGGAHRSRGGRPMGKGPDTSRC